MEEREQVGYWYLTSSLRKPRERHGELSGPVLFTIYRIPPTCNMPTNAGTEVCLPQRSLCAAKLR
ncbi:hypothetical protein J6590_078069 [Homalodisca vitripennis]|nr:hypothetical protein J6590_078069 [Homalodisca vitripennis]